MLITLINGSHHNELCWSNYKKYFNNKKEYEIVCYELLGHGNKRNNKIYNLEEYSQDLYEFLMSKKEKKNNIIAHSLGCLVLYYCLTYKFKEKNIDDYVNNIIFLSPGIGISNLTIPLSISYNLLIKGNFGNIEDVRDALFCKHTDSKTIINCYSNLEKNNHTNLLDIFIKSFFYKEFKKPILFIYGKYDKISPPKSICNIAHLFKEFHYKEFDCGHNLMLEYNWEEILKYILIYIENKFSYKNEI